MLILLLSLDSLGNHFHAEVSGECGDGADDRIVVVGGEAHDKRSIDLEIVEWETMKVAERRATGSEVVDAQLHAQRAQLLEHQFCEESEVGPAGLWVVQRKMPAVGVRLKGFGRSDCKSTKAF